MSKPLQQARSLLNSGQVQRAIPLLEQICRKDPKNARAWSWLGTAQASTGAWQKAEFCLRKSLALGAPDAQTLQALASALIRRKQYAEAVAHLRTAIKLQPDGNLYNDLAYCLQRLRQDEQAIAAYRQSLHLNPRQHLASRNLGLLYEQLHRPDQAREFAEQALANSPGDIESLILLAKLETRSREYPAAVQHLTPLLDRNLTPFQRAAVNLELGKIHDRLGDSDAAFRYLATGKQGFLALHGITDGRQKAYRDSIDHFRSVFTRPAAKRPAGDGLDAGVIFLVGFPRSGTTLTEQILEAHPDIVATHELPVLIELTREIASLIRREFTYPDDVDTLTDSEIELLANTYRQRMCAALALEPGDKRLLLDKLPLNIVHLGLISRLFPAAKLLLALRDPRDVCLSCYLQTFEVNPAMAQFLTLEDTARFYQCVMGLYLHYRDTLGVELLVTRYEAIVDDLENAARRMLAFIGLAWDRDVLVYHEKAKSRRVYTPSYQAVTQPIYREARGKWRAYAAQLQPILSLLEPFVREFGYDD